MPDYNPWIRPNGQVRVGINTNPREVFEDFYTGTIGSLVCGSTVNYGTLTEATAAVGASFTINYTGGNGGTHPVITIQSSGVTGLVATLEAGSYGSIDFGNIDFNNPTNNGWGGQNQITSDGTLTFNITGTPNTSGIATFLINVGGFTCSLNRNVEVDAFVLSANLSNGDLIDGNIGTTTGHYHVEYWDGSTEIKSSWSIFQKTCTTTGTNPKLIKIYPCDVNGNKSGDIFDVNLTNNKYLAFNLNKVRNLNYLTIKNNQVITQSDLDFSLLNVITRITLENLPSYTGASSFTNISYWTQPKLFKSDWTLTSNRSEWDTNNRINLILQIKNLPISSLDISNLGGLDTLEIRDCSNLSTINTTNCENLESLDARDNLTSLGSMNLSTVKYLRSLIINAGTQQSIWTTSPSTNLTSITLPTQPTSIETIDLRYTSLTSLNFSGLTSLKSLSLFNTSTFDSTLESSFYSNTNLKTTLKTLQLENINFSTINFSDYSIISLYVYNLPNVSSISLPSTIKSLNIYRLPSMSTSSVDSIITQIDGFGLSNGSIGRSSYGQNDLLRTNASDTALSNIFSRGWYSYGNNALSLSNL